MRSGWAAGGLVLGLLVWTVAGCGVTQHNLIAHKAFGWLDPVANGDPIFAPFAAILKENQDAFQNGAAFPDWG